MITIYLKQYNKIVRNPDLKIFDELGYDDILWIDLLNASIKEQKEVEKLHGDKSPDTSAGRRD